MRYHHEKKKKKQLYIFLNMEKHILIEKIYERDIYISYYEKKGGINI